MKLAHLVGFITNKSVTMYGHMNVKLGYINITACLQITKIKATVFVWNLAT
jgi:hypothetical protein